MQTDLAPALTRFGFDLHRRLAAGQEGNLVSSPYSVAAVLAMALAGARGETADQLRDVLGGDQAEAIASLERSLARRDEEGVAVSVANRLWAHGGLRWSEDFLRALRSAFGAEPATADFAAEPDTARREINAWVAERTRQRIVDLLAPGVVDPDTRLVLVNAIHLRTPWIVPFGRRATAPGPFHRLDGSTAETLFMHGSAQGYASGPGWEAVDLRAHGELGLVVLLPEGGRFAELEATVDDSWLSGLRFRRPRVDLALPRWTVRSESDLKPALAALGLPLVFGPGADFGGMTTDERLHASAAVQQAFVAVDEEGVEAAAATGLVMARLSAPVEHVTVTVDRPFLYVLRDTESGTPLFIGRVLDPTVHETDA